jgi:hypothetical protein
MTIRLNALLALVLAAPALLASPLAAAVYTWTDEKGVVHMTDRKVEDPKKRVTEIPDARPSAPPGAGRAESIRAMVAAARANPQYADLVRIVREYKQNHSYSTKDYFVCIDMALELSNILKTRNFTPRVVAGSVDVETAGMEVSKMPQAFNHAWVVVEMASGANVAVETTGGYIVDDQIPKFEYYYQGLVFTDPRQAKETNALLRDINENCRQAKELIDSWNATQAGRPVDAGTLVTKGRVDAKIGECTGYRKRYEDLLSKQYRKLY